MVRIKTGCVGRIFRYCGDCCTEQHRQIYLVYQNAGLYFPYYAAGFFAYKYYDFLIAKRKIIYAMVLAVSLFCWSDGVERFSHILSGSFTNLWRNGHCAFYCFHLQIHGCFFENVFSSFLVELARKIRLYNFFCWMGILSMDIYVCHGNFIYLRGLGEGDSLLFGRGCGYYGIFGFDAFFAETV